MNFRPMPGTDGVGIEKRGCRLTHRFEVYEPAHRKHAMQNGKEPGPDDVKIEGEETRDDLAHPVDPKGKLDEIARSAGDGVKEDDEAAPEDPEEAQSPT